jgi:hypothetical protein
MPNSVACREKLFFCYTTPPKVVTMKLSKASQLLIFVFVSRSDLSKAFTQLEALQNRFRDAINNNLRAYVTHLLFDGVWNLLDNLIRHWVLLLDGDGLDVFVVSVIMSGIM